MILLLITVPKIKQNNHNKFSLVTMIGMIYMINDIYICISTVTFVS
jgi:hypothetical protein